MPSSNTIPMTWHEPGARGDACRSLCIAVLLTAGIFIFLPLTEILAPLPESARAPVTIETAPPPPLPPPTPPARARTEMPRAASPMPQLTEPLRRLAPIGAPLRMDLTMHTAPSDFTVNFPMAPEVSLAGPPGEYIFEIAETDRVPRPLARLAPLYPPQARMRRIEGEVLVEFVVTPDGGVGAAEVVYAQPPDVFNQTALQTIQRWRFEPGLKDGTPVPVRVRQKLTFKLEE